MLTQEEYDKALNEWSMETMMHSFPHTILRGSGFEKIKSFGKEALPFLFKSLEHVHSDGHNEVYVNSWGIMWYLPSLVGEDVTVTEPIMEGWVGGNWKKSVLSWINYGKKKGYLKE